MENKNDKLVLNSIVNITGSRDLEILEVSLMKTIFETVTCVKVFLLKSENVNDIKFVLCYDMSGFKDIEIRPGINVESVKTAINAASETGNIEVIEDDKATYIVCPVVVCESNIAFIVIETLSYREQEFFVLDPLIKIYQNYVSLLVDNQRDTLTGLLNRKTFDDRIMKLVELKKNENLFDELDIKLDNGAIRERRKSAKKRFWLGMFDIDHFKRVNDTYGHVFGDEVLLTISQMIQSFFRAGDFKFRYGGEEFITVVMAENKTMAFEIFERFRSKVESYSFPQIGRITISIGITEITGYEMPTAFVGSADKALYYAKEHGRNMTCVYSDLVRDGSISSSIMESRVIIFDE